MLAHESCENETITKTPQASERAPLQTNELKGCALRARSVIIRIPILLEIQFAALHTHASKAPKKSLTYLLKIMEAIQAAANR